MTNFLMISLAIIAAYFALRYFQLEKAARKLQRNISEKRQLGTNLLLTSPVKNRYMSNLIMEINELFDELQEVKIVSGQEKKTLDLAIHNITHDIRTPLTIASGYTQQLLRSERAEGSQTQLRNEELTPMLTKIKDNLETVSERLETLLEYQNLQEMNVKPDLKRIDFSQFLTQNLLNYYDVLTKNNITTEIKITEDIFIENDPDILERILQNLFGNVIKHGKEQLSVTLTTEKKYAVMKLDNISQKPINNIERLTSRFYSENMSETEKSSGLGLYVVKELAELTYGHLEMGYQASWFTVRLYFPLSK